MNSEKLSDKLQMEQKVMANLVDSFKKNKNDKNPITIGKLNGKKVKILRDTGCSTVAVRENLVNTN